MASKRPKIVSQLRDLPTRRLSELKELQGDLKHLKDREYDKLKKSLLEHDIFVPFFVWLEADKLIDGHQRKRVFEGEGWGDLLVPVVYVSAENEIEAKKKLLVISSQYGKITQDGWTDFTFDLDEEWTNSSVYFDALPMVFDELESFDIDTKKSSKRKLPLDVIYTLQGADLTCCLAVQAGLKYGIQSGSFRLCPYCGELSGRHKVEFVDNDYLDYDHAKHLETVQRFNPKYATVRDIMTRDQCLDAGIEYYPLDRILAWADEMSTYTSNVILIPKYDCLKDIPEKYILGYSIPTSHGGTPLDPDLFRGRRIHLLGGSWKEQLRYLMSLGEHVVSLDNNYILKQANYGSFVLPDGENRELPYKVNNIRYSAFALSVGAIGVKIKELYGDESSLPELDGIVWDE